MRGLVSDLVAGASLSRGARVVDYGCADTPYADLLPTDVAYVAADLGGNPGTDVVLAPDGTVPLPAGTIDLVLSTQVLEHVTEPAAYLLECARLLRPGGSLILTTHGMMYRHPDPEDYWRWTSDGLVRVVTQAGLEVVELRGVLGLVAASLQLIQHAFLTHLPAVLRRPCMLLFQALIAGADRLTSDERRRQDALVFGVRAVRPLSQA